MPSMEPRSTLVGLTSGYISEARRKHYSYSPMEVSTNEDSLSSPSRCFLIKIFIGGAVSVLILLLIAYVTIKDQVSTDTSIKNEYALQRITEEKLDNTVADINNCKNNTDTSILDKLSLQRTINDELKINTKKVILTLSPLSSNDLKTCILSTKAIHNACSFTSNSSKISDADAIIATDADLHIINNMTNHNQTLIYRKKGILLQSEISKIQKMNFSFIATYDWNSDIPILPMYWARKAYRRLSVPEYKKATGVDDPLTAVVYIKNCGELELFENIKEIKELQNNNVTITWLGGCNKTINDCSDLESSPCFQLMSTKYKFALSFETFEGSYISARFFDPLNNTIIPIVFGTVPKSKYESVSPLNSFIYYSDYKIDELIILLNELNKNETAHKSYFNWMNKEGSFWPYSLWYCQVCGMLYRSQSEIDCIKSFH